MASPAFLAAALAGCAALFGLGRRVEAAVVAVAITGGVFWSNALAYHDVSLAPRGQLHELETIGHSFAGQGPALMTSYEPYGARHFLRREDPEGASELRRRFDYLRNGQMLDKGESADIDRLRLGRHPRLPDARAPARAGGEPSALGLPPRAERAVLRGLAASRVRRADDSRAPLARATRRQAAAVPRCSDVLRLARKAEAASGYLATATRPRGDPRRHAVPDRDRLGADQRSRGGPLHGLARRRLVREVVGRGRRARGRREAGGAELARALHRPRERRARSRPAHGRCSRTTRAACTRGAAGRRSRSARSRSAVRMRASPSRRLRRPPPARLCGRRLDWIEAVR